MVSILTLTRLFKIEQSLFADFDLLTCLWLFNYEKQIMFCMNCMIVSMADEIN